MNKQSSLWSDNLSLKYFKNYLEVMPLSLALLRSIEAKYLASGDLTLPILDLGCGTGEFAQGFFRHQQVYIGLDISLPDVIQAKKTYKYHQSICADGRKLPFKNNCFNSVVSVSTLEHINQPDRVITEIFRVLAPGGKLVMTVNTPKIGQMLYWPNVLKKLGLSKLAESYTKFFHQVFKHRTLWGEHQWRNILTSSGFKQQNVKQIFSPEAISHFDRWLPTALIAQLFKLTFGRRWVYRPSFVNRWLANRYGWLVEKPETVGGNLFIVTSKP